MANSRPVHNWQVYRREQWSTLPGVASYGRRLRIEHSMAVPLYGSRGYVAGMLTICRRPQDQPFNERGVTLASVFAGYLSATLARVSDAAPVVDRTSAVTSSQRELQGCASVEPQ